MNVLIVDDEQLARQRLRHMLSGMGQQVVGEAASGEQALQQTINASPDVVLMDIRMPGMDGLEAAGYINQMDNPPAIIFTTAYSDHALKAFETHAVDYLLKPIKQERLANAISAAKRLTRAQIQRLRVEDDVDIRSKICVKCRGSLELVPIEDIIYFKADQKYVTLKTDDHEFLIEESLKALEQEFNHRFVRIHRNALVSENHIAGLSKNDTGHHCIVLNETDDLLEISRRHLPFIRKKLKNLSL
ncbi:MAG: response regulator transcription factor [Gammaproteobacteria bacterium]|nr:LytTR family DNA-binding domain-containing protein [Gammaproteobacteria bacterium]NNJ97689.1 response regulator transcription factor [Gammaproteobacteria bacterium]